MTATSLPRCFTVLVCLLAAAASPAVAGEDAGAGAAAQLSELRREANAAAARYHQAENELARLNHEVAGLNAEIEALEARMGRLREAGTRGAALLYMRDAMVDSVAGLGDGSEILRSARRSKLVGNMADLAGAALGDLDRGLGELEGRRQALEVRQGEQGAVVAELQSERRDISRRLAAMARVERERQARERAAARAAAQARQAAATPAPAPPAAAPSSFVCPIKGPVAFSNDFGGRRRHRGNDLMNPRGTENVAVVSGTASTRPWGGGAGLTLFLHGDDGNLYLYMHLLRFVGPLPRHVQQGEVVALTGATGNATAYHTHFEFHPGGGPAVNPYPLISAHC